MLNYHNCCEPARPAWCNWVRWIVAAILLLLLLRGCWMQKHEVVPTVAPTTAAETAHGVSFTSELKDGHLILTGAVKDQATKDAIIQAATAQYGADHVTDQLTIDAAASNPSMDLGKLFAWQKSAGITGIAIHDKTVLLTGTVTDDIAKVAQGQVAQDLFGAAYRIDNQLQIAVVSNMAKDSACEETLKSSIEFASGQSVLAAKGKEILDQVSTCLKEGRFEVAGHTDNQGNAPSNQTLSEARAASVVAYLTRKGIAADRMVAKGYGQSQPIASNDTAEGRQQNRRITFVALP
ncbi:OmpA family protein [Aquirhabdus parva]|uniref:BON domain-containing protein n=1 Tax=Aquirhabdus parva TaxID=2283318 RepID=A0A345P9X2_9GAMM|nr:OmpA family protein [Aquirhabdus parva]AXI04081.1 BON domain-containing protein [Aquirhabdus parva]